MHKIGQSWGFLGKFSGPFLIPESLLIGNVLKSLDEGVETVSLIHKLLQYQNPTLGIIG